MMTQGHISQIFFFIFYIIKWYFGHFCLDLEENSNGVIERAEKIDPHF
jgi:hypothetical protein